MTQVDDGGPRRIETAIPRLDYILHGGFLRAGTYAVQGPPGSGKTILANQICFNAMRLQADMRCVYVTLLVESHAKMISHLRAMRFFDEALVPQRMVYVSGYPALQSQGLTGLLQLLRKTLRAHHAGVLVVDGLESVEQAATGHQAYREFVHELQGLATMTDATVFLLSNLRDRAHDENALVDGVVELSDSLIGPRAVRELTVHKFRGSDYLRGRHEVAIDASGIVVHPRTEIQFEKPSGHATEMRKRMPFGIPSLDQMIGGGLPSGSTTALLGSPGTGKTILGLSFLLDGARSGEPGTYFGFFEPPPRLIAKSRKLGIDLQPYIDDGLIEIDWHPPLEHMMDSLAEQLLEPIRQDPRGRRRVFIDGIEGFRTAAVYPERVPRFLSALTNQLRTLDVTTLVSEELDLFTPMIQMPNPELGNVVESVILLRYVELRSQLHRLISILKMRESIYETSIREFKITDDGIEVSASFDTAEQILTGTGIMRGSRSGEGAP